MSEAASRRGAPESTRRTQDKVRRWSSHHRPLARKTLQKIRRAKKRPETASSIQMDISSSGPRVSLAVEDIDIVAVESPARQAYAPPGRIAWEGGSSLNRRVGWGHQLQYICTSKMRTAPLVDIACPPLDLGSDVLAGERVTADQSRAPGCSLVVLHVSARTHLGLAAGDLPHWSKIESPRT